MDAQLADAARSRLGAGADPQPAGPMLGEHASLFVSDDLDAVRIGMNIRVPAHIMAMKMVLAGAKHRNLVVDYAVAAYPQIPVATLGLGLHALIYVDDRQLM